MLVLLDRENHSAQQVFHRSVRGVLVCVCMCVDVNQRALLVCLKPSLKVFRKV